MKYLQHYSLGSNFKVFSEVKQLLCGFWGWDCFANCCFGCQEEFKLLTSSVTHTHTHLHWDNVSPRGVGHCHPVWQVHAAVTVGPEEGVRVGDCQRSVALPPLGGVLWWLHKGNWNVRRKRKRGSVISVKLCTPSPSTHANPRLTAASFDLLIIGQIFPA